MPAIYVINKIDQITLEELNVISKLPHYSPVCAYLEWNLDGLVDMIWEYLDLIRVYTKPKASITGLSIVLYPDAFPVFSSNFGQTPVYMQGSG